MLAAENVGGPRQPLRRFVLRNKTPLEAIFPSALSDRDVWRHRKLDPVLRDELFPFPLAIFEKQKTDLGEISRRQIQAAFGIRQPSRRMFPVIMHAQGPEKIFCRILVDILSREFLEDVRKQ